MSCYHDSLISLTISAMLTSGLLATAPGAVVCAGTGLQPSDVVNAVQGLGSAGWQETPGLAAPAIPSPLPIGSRAKPAQLPFTEEQMRKLIAMMSGPHSHELTVMPEVAAMLGLAKNGETIRVRTVTVRDHGFKYQITRLSGSNNYLIGQKDDADVSRIVMVDEHFSLISGMMMGGEQPPVVLPISDAANVLQQGIVVWAKIADSLPAA